ncbi:MAG: hypothetical protein FJW39_19730 [Acidobacteria bacterium]|nr:hypothetical protein [Acidobacteriota bacterium]
MPDRKVQFLVEGNDDAYFIKHFAKCALGMELRVNENMLSDMVSLGTCNKLLDRIDSIQKDSGGWESIGVILDSNGDPLKRWAEVLESAGPHWGLPQEPCPAGVIGKSGLRRMGFWLMPEPGRPGALEDFLIEIRKDSDRQNRIWGHARQSVETLPERLFKDGDLPKAELRTWLSWQKEPGAPYGLAVSQGCFDIEHRLAKRFAAWMRSVRTPCENL